MVVERRGTISRPAYGHGPCLVAFLLVAHEELLSGGGQKQRK